MLLAGVDQRTLELELRARRELSGQQLVCVGLLCLSGVAYRYDDVANAIGIRSSTVKTYMRRVRVRHADLYESVMARRRLLFDGRHADVLERRRRRSLLWGRRRYAAKYRATFGRWPWDDFRPASKSSG